MGAMKAGTADAWGELLCALQALPRSKPESPKRTAERAR